MKAGLLILTTGQVIAVVIGIAIGIVVLELVFWFSRYKRCPANKIMVIYGKVRARDGKTVPFKCVHGGAVFVWPIMQKYAFLDLAPIPIDLTVQRAMTADGIPVDLACRFSVAVSTEKGVTENAAERLLFLEQSAIAELTRDVLFGQTRLAAAQTHSGAIFFDRDKFLEILCGGTETELKRIGLCIVNAVILDAGDKESYEAALAGRAERDRENGLPKA
ncbi:hypothetical protein FACS1894211_16950 [Clostridia bacterium]|nr:hypothetical protein FACS1894211_16950 [Clostridia bacterium]